MTIDTPETTDGKEVSGLPDHLMHVMLRVGDLDRSLTFYTEQLGMKLLHRNDFPEARFTLAFVGYGDADSHTVLELTHNWDTSAYEHGSAYGHLALSSSDIYGLCAQLEKRGVKVVRPPGPMKGGPELAFIEDPDGYKIELIQEGTLPD
jgi:lactoylglutathione lyase